MTSEEIDQLERLCKEYGNKFNPIQFSYKTVEMLIPLARIGVAAVEEYRMKFSAATEDDYVDAIKKRCELASAYLAGEGEPK